MWDAVLVSQQSALAWAAAQKEPKQCGFDPHTTDTPYEGYWCAELTLHAPSNQWRVLYVTNVVTLERWFNIYNIDHWIGWRQVSLAVTPEVHDLPLADGWQAYGEGLCWYTRNQFKEVTIGMLLRSTSALTSDGAQFATLPEGFRPKVTVIAPANVTANDYSHSACHVTINPDGGVYLHFDASSLSEKTVIQLVCPVFHYPVG